MVKSVLDGGSVVIRGQPRNGPPPERILALAEVDAPRMARRSQVGKDSEPDQPFAWEARYAGNDNLSLSDLTSGQLINELQSLPRS